MDEIDYKNEEKNWLVQMITNGTCGDPSDPGALWPGLQGTSCHHSYIYQPRSHMQQIKICLVKTFEKIIIYPIPSENNYPEQ